MDRYVEYFDAQVGGGKVAGVGRIFVGSNHQRGHGGIGRFLAGLFRRVMPLLSRGAKAVGKEALRTGMNIMSDVTTMDTPVKEAFKSRVRESGEILKRKAEEKLDKLMEGSGYKIPRLEGSTQLSAIRGRGSKKRRKPKKKIIRRKRADKTKKKKKKSVRSSTPKRTTRDIFG